MLTEAQVLEAVAEHAGPAAAATFSTRLELSGGDHPGAVMFPAVVACPGDRYLVFVFSFGHPDPDPQLDWKPAWHYAQGPMSRQELDDFARRLKEEQAAARELTQLGEELGL